MDAIEAIQGTLLMGKWFVIAIGHQGEVIGITSHGGIKNDLRLMELGSMSSLLSGKLLLVGGFKRIKYGK